MYISSLSPVCFLLNIQIRGRKTAEIAKTGEARDEKKERKKNAEERGRRKKNGTTDRRSRGDRAEKMNSRAATCRSANRARAYIWPADEYFTISGFRLDFALSLCFREMGYPGLARGYRLPLLSFSLIELTLPLCNDAWRHGLSFQL